MRVELHRRLAGFLGLNQPVTGFRRAVKDHPVMGVLARKFPGLRIPQVPSLWEGLCWAIIGQQINLAFAYRLRNRLIALGNGVGSKAGDGLNDGYALAALDPPYPFPSPAQVLAIPEEAWRPAQFSRQKTVYLKELARACEEGRLVEETLRGMPDEEAREALISIKGLGPWSAAYGLLRALGRVDALPVGDAGLRASLKLHFALEALPSPAEQEALMEDFRPYRGLATYCLWKALGQSRQE
jgi:3-methyladenine DNA glycosylase/8-oxoguanine DNA glycosylase